MEQQYLIIGMLFSFFIMCLLSCIQGDLFWRKGTPRTKYGTFILKITYYNEDGSYKDTVYKLGNGFHEKEKGFMVKGGDAQSIIPLNRNLRWRRL